MVDHDGTRGVVATRGTGGGKVCREEILLKVNAAEHHSTVPLHPYIALT
jgi:hypothetical protein